MASRGLISVCRAARAGRGAGSIFGSGKTSRTRASDSLRLRGTEVEVVVLQDVMSSYASTWLRIAKTQGTETIRVGDVIRRAPGIRGQ